METFQIIAIRQAFKRHPDYKYGLLFSEEQQRLYIQALSIETGIQLQEIEQNLELIQDLGR